MSDWQKSSFPPPRARLPLDIDEWENREPGVSNLRRGLEADSGTITGRVATRPGTRHAQSAHAAGTSARKSRPVPRMPKSQPESKVRSPGITLAGTLLILGLTVLAFAGGRLFGRVEEPATGAQPETPAQTVPVPALELAPAA